ncbi:MAG: hypothetical protein NTW31_00965 [Bacteroidetes bacterium]|nr:hypothetical protein [Bacteroidota bacterium]
MKAGDRIYKIDGINIKDIRNPFAQLAGAPHTFVKLTGIRYPNANAVDVSVPRISLPSSDAGNYISEGILTTRICTDDFSNHNVMVQSSMAVLDDEDADIFKLKTYDFDYISAADPLLEKEIFKVLETRLSNMGMKRSKLNPDILILMNYYSGQKEQYVPPQQIISTHIDVAYDWYWGFVPMPITESATKGGYTDVTYLYSISLKFLDAHKIQKSKLPPVFWSGSISQASKSKTPILDNCNDFFMLLLYQFPTVWIPNSEYYKFMHYTYTGIIYNLNDMRTIAEVIPGSPAAIAGIQTGDEILNIHSLKIPVKYSDAGNNQWSNLLNGKNSGLRYLFLLSNLVFQPYSQKNITTLSFTIKRNGKRMKFDIKPEDKTVFSLIKNG